MAVEFYDVKTRTKVKVEDRNIVKFTMFNGQTRFGLSARTPDGRQLTKFVTEQDWDNLRAPVSKSNTP